MPGHDLPPIVLRCLRAGRGAGEHYTDPSGRKPPTAERGLRGHCEEGCGKRYHAPVMGDTVVEMVERRMREADEAIMAILERSFAESLTLTAEELKRREVEALKKLVP